jgi:membrane-associated phospholipid phosphatase
MDRISDSPTQQLYGNSPAHHENKLPGTQRIIWIALWLIGAIILGVAAVIVHSHTAPWPVELAFTKYFQGPHPVPCPIPIQPHSWIEAALFDVSILNNPIPSIIGAAIVVGGLLFLRWWRQALFFVAAVASAGGLFLLLTPLVGRPRPNVKNGICVHDVYSYYSFPSGHVTHDVVCYGFLLFLTFTKPAREWRYRWVLIPLQLFFVCDLLFIGYSRVLEGDHWLFDVLGGYLTGALCLLLFIFLYRWVTDQWTQHRHQKMVENKI